MNYLRIACILLSFNSKNCFNQIRSFNVAVDSNYCFSLESAENVSGTITYLDLGWNKQSDFEQTYSFCSSVQFLSLIHDSLGVVPNFVYKCAHLKVLLLGGNNLKNLDPKISELQNLQDLNLAGNQLCCLPKDLSRLKNLRFISLASNRLKHIPKVLDRMNSLEWIDLVGNELAESDILEFKKRHPTIRVDYSNNHNK